MASFLISLFPLLINIWGYFSSTEKLLLSESHQKLEVLIEVRNNSINVFSKYHLRKAKAFAEMPSVISAFNKISNTSLTADKHADVQAFGQKELLSMLQRYRRLVNYENMFFLSLNGEVLFNLNAEAGSGSNGPLLAVFTESLSQDLLETVRTKNPVLHNVELHSDLSELWVFAFAPVVDEGRVIGVIALQVNQQELSWVLEDDSILGHSGEFLFLGESEGVVTNYFDLRFTHPTGSRNDFGLSESAKRELYREVMEKGGVQGDVASTFIDYRGKEVLSLWRKLDAFDRVLAVKVDHEELFSDINGFQSNSLLVALVSIILVIPASFFLARAISIPIKNLEKATVHIAAGNRDFELHHEGGAEISALAVSFQLMALRVESFKQRLTKQLSEQQKLARKFEKARDHAEKGEAIISSILDHAAESMVTLDAYGHVQSFNTAAESTFQWSKEEALGQPFSNFLALDETDKKGPQNLFDRLTLGSQELIGVNYKNEQFPVELALAKVQLESEVLYTAIIRDITEQKKTQYYLEQAKHAAEEANHSKTLFLANVSHELKTPMNSILGFTRRLVLRLKGQISEQDLDCLETVHNNAENLLALITDLLDLSTLEAGEMKLNVERVDIVSLLVKVGKQLTPLAEEKHLSLNFDLPAQCLELIIDPRKVSQIAVNLLYNSIKYTDTGSVSIGLASVDDPDFEGGIKFYVRDTGIGIREQDQKYLFKNFSQLDAGSDRERDGAGLGLAITAELVALHGGKIEVESRFGEGSQFSVTLPRAS